MKKIVILVIAAVSMALVACGKEEASGKKGGFTSLSGTIEYMPTGAEKYELKLYLILESPDPMVAETRIAVATCDVAANGTFSLGLPETVNEDYLINLDDVDILDSPDMIFSNPDAKVVRVSISLYGDDHYMDDLVYVSVVIRKLEKQTTLASPIYCDSDCTVTGSSDLDGIQASVNISLVKGWNWIVINTKEELIYSSGSITSKRPTQTKWYLKDFIMF